MNEPSSVERLFGVVGPDAGCEGALLLLPGYAEDALAGKDVEVAYAGVANHLASCPDCREDYEGLLECLKKALGSGSS